MEISPLNEFERSNLVYFIMFFTSFENVRLYTEGNKFSNFLEPRLFSNPGVYYFLNKSYMSVLTPN